MANGKLPLSGSTNGKAFLIDNVGVTIHTAAAGTGTTDRIWVWATNTTGAACTITVYHGAVVAANIIGHAIPITANGVPVLIVPGIPLNNATVLSAVASVTNVVSVAGYVDRQTTGT